MTKKFFLTTTPLLALVLAASVASPALALVPSTSTTSGAPSAVTAQRIAAIKERADMEINRRITALTRLETRISEMKRITAAQKTSLTASVNAQIAAMNTLKAKIDADTDLATLKTDVQSITKSYRIFILIIPQGVIMAAGDRILTIGDLMTTLAGKLQTRLTAAQTAGKDVTALLQDLTDMTAKISDADVQANAAITEVAGLTPDNGDQAKAQANRAALLDARAKIRAGMQDLQNARKDALTIIQGLKQLSPRGTPNAHATSSAGAHASSTAE